MKSFTTLTSTALPIRTKNIDTDQIIPAIFLKTTKREGLGKYLFYNWRFDEKGEPKKNQFDPPVGEAGASNYRTPKILIVGNNFGCGSSREHAVWALQDYGFKTIISSSFGDIFYNNALKNGLLPIVVKPEELEKLFDVIEKNPNTRVVIDLKRQKVTYFDSHPDRALWRVEGSSQQSLVDKDSSTSLGITQGRIFHFPIDQFRKSCLLKGVDELGYILSYEERIKNFEREHQIFLRRK